MESIAGDIEALVREKYHRDRNAKGVDEDIARLERGEPLAYVIGNIPFLGITVHLDSHPLIPRPETEWWAEELIQQIGNHAASVLDLCAGSGAIGLSILKHCPNARVSFGELVPEHTALIAKNIETNGLEASRAAVRTSDLFAAFANERFDFIATNPPYIPDTRSLDASVTTFEPKEALFAGNDGLEVISRISRESRNHLTDTGELWMECDIDNIQAAQSQALDQGYLSAKIHTDQYGRERVLVAQL